MHLAPQTLLQGRYRVHALIAQGGMGAVYRALDERLGHTVALKQTLLVDPQLRAAFEQEARLLASLHHVALPVVSDHFNEGNDQFLVMQFIPGPDLATELQQRGTPFSLNDVLPWADRLFDVLDYLHTRQPPVIHRDIKPQNIKCTPRGDLILLDFGLAKGSLEAAKSVVGYTPRYAPLEQIQGRGTDPRSDLFAAAATLYELLTAEVPPDALTRGAAVIAGKPDPLVAAHQRNPALPLPLSDLLTSALALDPADRPPSAAAMRTALRGLQHSGQSSAGNATLILASPNLVVNLPTVAAAQPPSAATSTTVTPPTLPAQSGTMSTHGILALIFGLTTLAVLAIGALALSLFSLTAEPPLRAQPTTPPVTVIAATTPITAVSTPTPGSAPTDWPAQTTIPVSEFSGGTRAEPFPPDQRVTFGGWEIGINEVIRGEEAWQRMRAANQFNDPPPEDMEYVLLRLALRTTFSPTEERQLYPKLVGERRIVYASSGVAPDPRPTTTLPGASVSEGYFPFVVGIGETNLLLKLEQLGGSDAPDPLFMALEPGNALPDDQALAALEPNQLGVDHRDPAPIGTTAILEDWEVTVYEVVRGDSALDMLIAAYGNVERPVPGREYALVYLNARYIGAGDDSVRIGRANLESVLTDDPNNPPGRISAPPAYILPTPEVDHILFPGGSAEGWAVIELPVDNRNVALVFRGTIFFGADDPLNVRYFALE